MTGLRKMLESCDDRTGREGTRPQGVPRAAVRGPPSDGETSTRATPARGRVAPPRRVGVSASRRWRASHHTRLVLWR
jgi:hypothetical protein